jgi:DUF4097 and DUF4098 domain-containing protein YvlB
MSQTRGMGRLLAIGAGAVLAVTLAGWGGLQVVAATTGGASHDRHRTMLPASVRHLTIDTNSGDVTVTAAAVSRPIVRTHVASSFVEPDLDRHVHGYTAAIHAGCPGYLGTASCHVTFRVQVPADTDISVRTGSGQLTVEGVAGAVRANSGSGDVRTRNLAGPVRLQTSSGTVTGTGLRADSVRASTSSGDVTLGFADGPRTVQAGTSSGGVTIAVPPAAAYRVRADTSSGDKVLRVRTDPQATRTIRAHTASGDITVRYRP